MLLVADGNDFFVYQEHITEQQQRLDDFELATKQMTEELDRRENDLKVKFHIFLFHSLNFIFSGNKKTIQNCKR